MKAAQVLNEESLRRYKSPFLRCLTLINKALKGALWSEESEETEYIQVELEGQKMTYVPQWDVCLPLEAVDVLKLKMSRIDEWSYCGKFPLEGGPYLSGLRPVTGSTNSIGL